jgi:transposase
VQAEFQRDIRLGDLFLFLNRRLDRIKLLDWDGDGLLIWMKRLESGSFQRPRGEPGVDHVKMDATDLAILLASIELASVKRRTRYRFTPAQPTLESTSHAPSRTTP